MAQMLASDLNNPAFVGASNPDAALAARFHTKAVQNLFQSSQQGRPIYQDVIYVEIFTPGNTLNIIDTPMRAEHKGRFPREWAQFQNTNGANADIVGTRIESWPILTKAQAEELKGLKFFTIEMLAGASDQQVNNIGMIGGMAPMSLRERAKAYLNAAQGSAAAEHNASELAQAKRQLEEMQKQIQTLMAMNGQQAPVVSVKPNVEQAAERTEARKRQSEKMKAIWAAKRAAKQAQG